MNEELKSALIEIKHSVIVMMKNVWNVSDLALVLNVSESRIRHMASKHLIPSYKQNGSLYFKREEIEAWQTCYRTAPKQETESNASKYCADRKRI